MSPSLEINFHTFHQEFRHVYGTAGYHSLNITVERDVEPAKWNPLFGYQRFYDGELFDGVKHWPVTIKWGRARDEVELLREVKFYNSELVKVQGVAVPKFYGYYEPKSHGYRGLGCMILERMGGENTPNDEVDESFSRLEAICHLHKIGVRNNKLNEERNFTTCGGKTYVVDFSEASSWCGCEITEGRWLKLCEEMERVRHRYGIDKANRVLDTISSCPGTCTYRRGVGLGVQTRSIGIRTKNNGSVAGVGGGVSAFS